MIIGHRECHNNLKRESRHFFDILLATTICFILFVTDEKYKKLTFNKVNRDYNWL